MKPSSVKLKQKEIHISRITYVTLTVSILEIRSLLLLLTHTFQQINQIWKLETKSWARTQFLLNVNSAVSHTHTCHHYTNISRKGRANNFYKHNYLGPESHFSKKLAKPNTTIIVIVISNNHQITWQSNQLKITTKLKTTAGFNPINNSSNQIHHRPRNAP